MSTKSGKPLVPLITVKDDDCGTAMLALSPGHRAFVVAYVHEGLSRAEAARRAGYSANQPDDAKNAAYRLWRREDVQAAILEESRKVLRDEGPRSIKKLTSLRDDPKVDAAVQLKATLALLDRAGLSAVSEHHHVVEHHRSDAELDRRALELGRELGLAEDQIRKMLIDPDRVVDAEFTEVPTPEQAEQEAKREQERARRRQLRAASPEERAELKKQARAKRTAEQKSQYAAAQGNQLDIEDAIEAQSAPFDDLSDIFA